jgi:tetratricopeptide (TPR) repeat protein
MAAVTGGASPPSTDSERAPTAASEDRFLAKAAKEHAAGHVDPPLWARAVAQAGADTALATRIYLDSRATALRVAKRNANSARRARVVEVLSNAPDPDFVAEEAKFGDETASKEGKRSRRGTEEPNRRRMFLAAAALGSVIIVAGSIALWPENGPAQPTKLAGPASPVGASGRSASLRQTAAATTNTSEPVREAISNEEIVSRVQALEKAGNWNLLVIYAVEWTRKQPDNAAAWRELSRGYVKLRQFGESLDAAMKAVQVAPEDFLVWQNLGQLHAALQRPVEALSAFQRAVALNDRDAISLVQEGLLNTQLGHLSDARIAFDKALALSPENAEALCGAASLAQKEGRLKDAEAMMRQVSSVGGGCRDPNAGDSVRVAASNPAQSRPKPPLVRRGQ